MLSGRAEKGQGEQEAGGLELVEQLCDLQWISISSAGERRIGFSNRGGLSSTSFWALTAGGSGGGPSHTTAGRKMINRARGSNGSGNHHVSVAVYPAKLRLGVKTIIDMGFCQCVLELAIITRYVFPIFCGMYNLIVGLISTTQPSLWNIEMTLLEYSTGRPHPRAKNSSRAIT